MLFHVIFMQKNAKRSKKAAGKKNILPCISITRALQCIIQTDLGSYSAGLQLLYFDHFGKLVQWAIRWTLTCIIILVLVSSTFWSSLIIFSFFGYIQWTLKLVPDILYAIPIFSFLFLLILPAMKYSLQVLGIHMKSAMKYARGQEWNIHWKCQISIWKVK